MAGSVGLLFEQCSAVLSLGLWESEPWTMKLDNGSSITSKRIVLCSDLEGLTGSTRAPYTELGNQHDHCHPSLYSQSPHHCRDYFHDREDCQRQIPKT